MVFSWLVSVDFILRICSIFLILHILGNFGLYSKHYGDKLWRFCILLFFSSEYFSFTSAIIFLAHCELQTVYYVAALVSSLPFPSSFSSTSSIIPSPSLFSFSQLFLVCSTHVWFRDQTEFGNLLSGHFYHRISPLTMAFIVFCLYFSHYIYQKV